MSDLQRGDLPDILMITFDALRFDVAESTWQKNRTPFLRDLIPQGWEPRHSPGSFTYAAHAALFAGFWPTPSNPGRHFRPFVLKFPGSRSIGPDTLHLEGSDIVSGLAARGFHTVCIGGVGFFNPATPLGSVFPSFFQESHWRPEFGVSQRNSTRHQIGQACQSVQQAKTDQPLFLFINISATHPPTRSYLPDATGESTATQAAALEYVDRELSPLFMALRQRPRRGIAYLMSDHGTLFGEEGWTGHRIGHSTVWTVPYAELNWEAA
ncbi:MAG: STM4013/SEN3800 family hydrolase [Planctomycetota bacterium]